LSKKEEVELKKKAIEIAKSLLSKYYGGEEDEEEGITAGNLRNLLMIAREAEEAGTFELFRIKAPYVARNAEEGTPLWHFVRNLIQQVDASGYDDTRKASLVELVVTYTIYIHRAINQNLRSVVYPPTPKR